MLLSSEEVMLVNPPLGLLQQRNPSRCRCLLSGSSKVYVDTIRNCNATNCFGGGEEEEEEPPEEVDAQLSSLTCSTCFPSIQFTSSILIRHHHHVWPLSATAAAAVTNSSEPHLPPIPSSSTTIHSTPTSTSTSTRRFGDDQAGASTHDFGPLLTFVANSMSSDDDSASSSCSPTSLDPTEFQLAQSYGAVPAPLWHSLLKSLCASSSSSIGLAYAVVSWLQKHNLCFSYELLYSILIHALGRSEKLYEAFLLSQRQSLTPLTYNALIGACAHNGDLEKALHLMSRMRQDGYGSDFVNYSLIIQSLTRSNKIDSPIMLKLYREIESESIEIDGQLFNDIIAVFAKAGEPSQAMHLLAMVQATGLSPKTATLVAVISSLGNSGRIIEAEAIFEEMREGGLQPRTRAYNALLKGYVKAGQLKDAESIHTYSLLIDAYANAGRWESTRIVLKEMEAGNVQTNSYVFSRILASYRDRGEWQKSFQVLREMKSSGARPDRHFYNVMIDTFGKSNCLDHAMATLERMLSEGIHPDTVTWNTLIDCHCKSSRYVRAEELFEEMQQNGCAPCATTYNIMINSFGEQQRWDDVKGLLGKMQAQGLLPNIVTYTTLVDIYGKSGRFTDAIECLEVMKSAGMKPSPAMYNAVINAYAQRGLSEQALNAFRVMRADGLKPSPLALNSLINAFGEDRRDTEAFSVLQYMKENDLKPDVVTYTTLMKTLIRVDKFYKVPAVYEEMIMSGCTPDRKARAMLRYDMKIKAKPIDLYARTTIHTGHRARVSNIKGNCVPEFGNNDTEHSTP
ncbi:pentatricopeptide repeat-containing protein [Pyrus ussuriensis x Pyrus communis]|uniref:Pentatricopeptide repeat-containing protein n=1 Tax=Pyrus ussuriensis x Pyrus communis TaxID=2448454 RepID=A0A5N5I8K7_9ROSA|nr:pentatricopeptide repeat-containing protein [Pyrus ussuriensis x Pyrus communis]